MMIKEDEEDNDENDSDIYLEISYYLMSLYDYLVDLISSVDYYRKGKGRKR